MQFTKTQLQAAVVALQNLRETKVVWYERGSISDNLLLEVANTVLSSSNSVSALRALQNIRKSEVPEGEQQFVTDDMLKLLISTVLTAAAIPPTKTVSYNN